MVSLPPVAAPAARPAHITRRIRFSCLHRKLFRDLIHLRAQALAIALIVASAVATYVTMRGAYDSLLLARDSYYAEYRFADVFATVKRAPLMLVPRIRRLPGVSAVDTRVTANVTLNVPTLGEPASARITSIPDSEHALNALYLRRGRYPAPGARDEVLCSEIFLRENGLDIGATISAVINGRWRRLRITGIAASPDNVHEMFEGLFIDQKHFALLWMPRRELEAALGLDGAFNDLALKLGPGANETSIIASLDRMLDQYGGLGAYGRDEQPSNRILRDELAEDRVTSVVMPAIFIAVAAFLLNLVLTRLVASEREQIAVLKAFGYSDAAVAVHYLELALAIVAAGVLIGIPVGMRLGRGLTEMYARFFNFPALPFHVSKMSVVLSVGITFAAASLGAFLAARRAASLPPAEGMRGETPPRYSRGFLDRLGLQRFVSTPVRMIARSMERRPIRTLLSIIGLAMAAMILVVGQYIFDALEYLINVQFRMAQRDDATVMLINPRSSDALSSMRHLPGVHRVEAFRTVPVRIRYGHRERRIAITGIEPDSVLRLLLNQDRSRVTLPPRGIVLTKKLAEVLDVRIGDHVTIEALEGARPTEEMLVAGTVDEMMGINGWMERSELNRFMREGSVISGAYIAVDPARAPSLYAKLKETPAVATVALRELTLKVVMETVIENIVISGTMIVVFACVIAFGVIYNGARIALSERGRDLASLRVLGFTTGEVGLMLVGEQALLTILSLPVGFLGGWLLSRWIAQLFDSEVYRIPVVISGRTYALTFLIIAIAAALTSWLVQRRVSKLDLVEVLKTRE